MLHLSLAQDENTASAAFGALGTLVLFASSWSDEPREGGVFGGPILDAWNKKVDARNKRRRIYQRIGLGFLMIAFVLQGIATLTPAQAKTITVEYLQGNIDPKNVSQLGDLACRAMDKIIHLKITVDWPDGKRDQETSDYQRLVFWDDSAEYLFPKDTYVWMHGSYYINGYFIPRTGGMHQGVISNAFEKVDDASVLLNPAVKEVPAKKSGC
jgi:hypothetical protein